MLVFEIGDVTCDGASTNLSTMKLLGCKILGSYDELVEFYIIPGIDWKVKLLILSIKLCRNKVGFCERGDHNMYARRELLTINTFTVNYYVFVRRKQ